MRQNQYLLMGRNITMIGVHNVCLEIIQDRHSLQSVSVAPTGKVDDQGSQILECYIVVNVNGRISEDLLRSVFEKLNTRGKNGNS